MQKYSLIIGIDPDIRKSGVAILDTRTKALELKSLSLPNLMVELTQYQAREDILVVVEAGWVNKITNYHTGAYGRANNRIAYSVGCNHQIGKDIIDICDYFAINVLHKPPLRKIWRGNDRKITHEELSQFIPNLPKQTNQEERDACLLAWDVAGFTILIKK